MTFRLATVYPDVRIVYDGQSLNLQPPPGDGVSMPEVASAGLGYPFANVAFGGASWTALAAGTGGVEAAATRLNPVLALSAGVVLVLTGGTSDLIFEDDDGATVMADIVAYSDAARSVATTAGTSIHVIASTIPETFNMTGDEQTARQAFNTLLLADAGGDFDAVIDLTESEAGPLADSTDSTYYADGVHWNATGAAYAAGLIRPAIVTGIAALLA